MAQTKSFGDRVWSGDVTTVAIAREAARANASIENRRRYWVVLYSFRGHSRLADELFEQRDDIARDAECFLKLEVSENPAVMIARTNHADVLSTHLVWIAKRSLEKKRYLELALRVVDRGISCLRYAGTLEQTQHTGLLLFLDLGEIHSMLGNKMSLLSSLLTVHRQLDSLVIFDTKQRARVFRRLGVLLRRSGHYRHGYKFGLKACLVPGIPWAVRMKSLAALVGFER